MKLSSRDAFECSTWAGWMNDVPLPCFRVPAFILSNRLDAYRPPLVLLNVAGFETPDARGAVPCCAFESSRDYEARLAASPCRTFRLIVRTGRTLYAFPLKP